ncbi:MAG TPA: hypothetical protein ENN40_00900 [Candidatus Aminicenantes bacterium]|nr:hypothetical protein [Candidatus Aminicenantes bacterium]
MNQIKAMSKLTPFAITIVAILLVFPALAPAQAENFGGVGGFIYDGDGESPIKEARVILKPVDENGDEFQSEPTGDTGAYQISGLLPGNYIAAVRVKSGKVYTTLSVVKITAGKRLIRSFYLTPERPLAMLWKNPCGIALILSGTAVITKLVTDEPKEVSPTTL